MKRVLLLLVLVSALVSAATNGVFALWVDEDSANYCFQAGQWETHKDQDGSMGWWKNNSCDFKKGYGEAKIEGWLADINAFSCWLGAPTDAGCCCRGCGCTNTMIGWLDSYGGSSAKQKFLIQYMVQLLNQYSDRQSPNSVHNVTSKDPGNYLDLVDPHHAYGWEIIDAIEAKCGTSSPNYGVMKDVCDYLNNLDK